MKRGREKRNDNDNVMCVICISEKERKINEEKKEQASSEEANEK